MFPPTPGKGKKVTVIDIGIMPKHPDDEAAEDHAGVQEPEDYETARSLMPKLTYEDFMRFGGGKTAR